VRQGLPRQQFERSVVVDIAGIADHSAMPVRSVFAKANVRHDQHLRKSGFDRPHRFLDDPVFGIGFRANLVLHFGNPKKDNRPYIKCLKVFDLTQHVVDRKLELARHRRDFIPDILALNDEKRVD
jgi:hypothetical protein